MIQLLIPAAGKFNKSITVDAYPNPNYSNEIIIGDERFTIQNAKYKDIENFSILHLCATETIIEMKNGRFIKLD